MLHLTHCSVTIFSLCTFKIKPASLIPQWFFIKANLETKTWIDYTAQTEKAMKKKHKWQFCSQDLMFGILLCVQITRVFMANDATSSRDLSSRFFPTFPSPCRTLTPSSKPTVLGPFHFIPTTDLMQPVPPPCLFFLQTLRWTFHLLHSHSWTCYFIRNVSAVLLAWVCLRLFPP